jgi:hypothetical protein
MLINKITTGFVIQTFDTEKRQYISQNFVAGDQVDYESTDGQTPIEDGFMESVNFGPDAEKEPYLPFDMLQPDRIYHSVSATGPQLGEKK